MRFRASLNLAPVYLLQVTIGRIVSSILTMTNGIDVLVTDDSFHIFVSDPLDGDTFRDNRLPTSIVIDSEPPGLGSRLSTSIVIDLDDDNGINEVPSEPPGLSSRVSTSVDSSVIDLDEDNGIDVLIATI